MRTLASVWLRISVWLLVSAVLAAPASAQLNRNDQSIRALGKAWGYFVGQTMRLDRIEREHPALSSEVMAARMEFKAEFPNIEENARRTYLSWGGKDSEIEQMREVWRTQMGSVIEREPIDLATSRLFLQQVRGRAKGVDVPEDILRYLLALSFMDRPELELLRGWRQAYTSRGHPKSKGLTVNLKIPMSFVHREGERPNVVANWVSEGGHGTDTLMLMVTNSEGKAPSRREVEEDIREGANGYVHKALSAAGSILSVRAFSQEKAHGAIAEVESTAERAGMELTMRHRHYLLLLDGKDVLLSCGTAMGGRDEEKQLARRLARISELCRLVANSLVLPQQYQGGN